MRLQGAMVINGRTYAKGTDVSWYKVYPLFLVHMLVFGAASFGLAYADRHPPVVFLYAWGGFALLVYTVMYRTVFGFDEVKWMFINAVLGLSAIYSQIGWLLARFGKRIEDYPVRVHVIPFMYYVLYTFLLRHAVLDLTQSRDDAVKRKRAEFAYVLISAVVYVLWYYLWTFR